MPIPASPATSSSDVRPAAASPHACRSSASSSSRSTSSVRRRVGATAWWWVRLRRRLVAQQCGVQRLGLRCRAGAELLAQHLPEHGVGRQCAGRLPGGTVGRQHLARHLLVERVVGEPCRRDSNGTRGVARRERGAGERQPRPAKHGDLGTAGGLRPVRVRLVLEHAATRQQGAGLLGGDEGHAAVPLGQLLLGARGQPLGDVAVNLDVGGEQVAVPASLDRPRPEPGAQPAHERGDVLGRPGGRSLRPQHVDDPAVRHDMAALEGEHLEQRPGLAAHHPGHVVGASPISTANVPRTLTRTSGVAAGARPARPDGPTRR